MALTLELRELADRYGKYAVQHRAPAVQEVERAVCGCVYGSTSWTGRAEADRIATALGLGPEVRLLDLGSGAGWPGLYLAKLSGCDLAVVDLPLAALRVAHERAAADGVGQRCAVLSADAAALPFRDGAFDALSHSDLMCCTPDKAGVLRACRRVARDAARMAFTVIAVAPGLTAAQCHVAIASGPTFVAAPDDYAALLESCGWRLVERADLTPAFLDAMHVELAAVRTRVDGLAAVYGAAELHERIRRREATIAAVEAGLLRREWFVARA